MVIVPVTVLKYLIYISLDLLIGIGMVSNILLLVRSHRFCFDLGVLMIRYVRMDWVVGRICLWITDRA